VTLEVASHDKALHATSKREEVGSVKTWTLHGQSESVRGCRPVAANDDENL